MLRGARPQIAKHASLRLNPQLQALFTDEAQLVGIHEPRDVLVRWLMEDDPQLRVLAIVGFGGLSKTTLARMVCESPIVKGADFQCCPLFIVSQTFNIRILFQHMITELIQRPQKAMALAGGKHNHLTEENFKGIERWEVTVLAEKLRRYLQDKRNAEGYLLAIMSIASLLASKTNGTKQEWQKVCDNIGPELETNPTLEGAKQVLTLSYDDLPYHLKACFLYPSIFPENYVIKRGPLMRRWIAEGFVNQRHGLSMEQIAENYFDEFVARNMVQPVRIDWNGKVRSCRVHGMMLEVIISKSLEENFASLFCDNASLVLSHDKIRRLSIHSSCNLVQTTSASVSHVRSFTMSASVEEVPFFFPQLRLLRLKYLSLRKTNICKLPRLLGKLKHLETLDIRATLVKKLPVSANNISVEMAPGVAKNMAALQSLVHIMVKEQSLVLQEIGSLQNIRKLNVLFRNVEVNWKAFVDGKFTKLSILVVDNLENIDMVHFEEGSVPNLERLTLSFIREPKDGISGLENLHKLREIEFFGNIILSVVDKVVACAKTHPNHPRVIYRRQMEYCNRIRLGSKHYQKLWQ
ncbi:hypothetical protein U9M48_029687 [Paspalum notatum var. saurae]|uniref:NB-ARC domain-containing protein n=1 Tax=Paspalum notatum var. saurae TaxID=547442 RepID=A0AAQ3X2I9_PASNO